MKKKLLLLKKSEKALFLDRDGVININYGYVYQKKHFHFIKNIFKFTKKFFDKGYLIFVVTNQSGIARGLYSKSDFKKITKFMVSKFKKNGIKISKVYYCPFHPQFSKSWNCRKPNPKMILKAKKEFNLNLKKSILIGDSLSDIESGKRAGVKHNFLFDGDFNKLNLKLKKEFFV